MSNVLDRSLQGAVALVTGARGAIGRVVCDAIRDAGGCVLASGTGEPPSDLNADAWFKHDVTSFSDWQSVVLQVQRRFGRLDCLINCAGLVMIESITSTSLEQWRRVFSVNVESILLGLQASLRLLCISGEVRVGGSSVVNFSSVAGLRGIAHNTAYSASKGAVTLLSKSAAKEFAALRYPIRVNVIHPGGVETRMMDAVMSRYVELGLCPSIEAARASFEAMNPLGRLARPEEIAGGVVFLCSPAASFMTGADFVVDGAVTS